ncbi:MAG: prolyl oligopeptidase family serine peptidase [Terracidiphilus sp.]|jgi:acetyl esterase/lipase
MLHALRFLAAGLLFACATAPTPALTQAFRSSSRHTPPEPPQETGFLNRTLELRGVTYRFQVYLPETYRRDDRKSWPVILFLHGRGERGSEGMWQTQIGLPQAVRDHPERWPFVIVMPQCPLPAYWTDPEMLSMAMAALDRETQEFHLDPERTYLTGLSMGGYGAWELTRLHPRRWAAVAIAAGGVFWSYAPERWLQTSTLPAEYARAIGRTPLWLFHGSDDTMVVPRQSELMFEALKVSGGRVRLWVYQGLKHDCWTRAYNEPELPRWLLSHHIETPPAPELPPFAERLTIPLHPPAIKLASAVLDSLAGEYSDASGRITAILFRQGDQLYEKTLQGEIAELAAESPSVFFYPNGSSLTRLTFERDAEGRVTLAILRDDRHEERWEKRIFASAR